MTDTYNDAKDFTSRSGLDFTAKAIVVKDIYKREYRTLKVESITTQKLIDHFNGEAIYCLPKFKKSPYMIIDVDQRNQLKSVSTHDVITKLIQYLGLPFYIEYSYRSQGYHLYFEYTDYINKSALVFLTEYFKNTYGYVIEPVIGKHPIKIPFCIDYKHAGTCNNKGDIKEISSVAELNQLFKKHTRHSTPNILW